MMCPTRTGWSVNVVAKCRTTELAVPIGIRTASVI